jgi:hypothetical protein
VAVVDVAEGAWAVVEVELFETLEVAGAVITLLVLLSCVIPEETEASAV